jgi:hypothetical protein
LRAHPVRLRTALDADGIDHDIEDHPDVGRGFMNEHRSRVATPGWVSGFAHGPAPPKTPGTEPPASSTVTQTRRVTSADYSRPAGRNDTGTGRASRPATVDPPTVVTDGFPAAPVSTHYDLKLSFEFKLLFETRGHEH